MSGYLIETGKSPEDTKGNQYRVVFGQGDTPELWECLGFLPLAVNVTSSNGRGLSLPHSLIHLREGVTALIQPTEDALRIVAIPVEARGSDGSSLTSLLHEVGSSRFILPPSPSVNVDRFDKQLRRRVEEDWEYRLLALTKGEVGQMSLLIAGKLALLNAEEPESHQERFENAFAKALLGFQIQYLGGRFSEERRDLKREFQLRWKGVDVDGDPAKLPGWVKVAGAVGVGVGGVVGANILSLDKPSAHTQTVEVQDDIASRDSFLQRGTLGATVFEGELGDGEYTQTSSIQRGVTIRATIEKSPAGLLGSEEERNYWNKELKVLPGGIEAAHLVEKTIDKLKHVLAKDLAFTSLTDFPELEVILTEFRESVSENPQLALQSVSLFFTQIGTIAPSLDRNRRLQVTSAVLLALAAGGILSACGANYSPSNPDTSDTQPKMTEVVQDSGSQGDSETGGEEVQRTNILTFEEAFEALAPWEDVSFWISTSEKRVVDTSIVPAVFFLDPGTQELINFNPLVDGTPDRNIEWTLGIAPLATEDGQVTDKIGFAVKEDAERGEIKAFGTDPVEAKKKAAGSYIELSLLIVDEDGSTKPSDLVLVIDRNNNTISIKDLDSGKVFPLAQTAGVEGSTPPTEVPQDILEQFIGFITGAGEAEAAGLTEPPPTEVLEPTDVQPTPDEIKPPEITIRETYHFQPGDTIQEVADKYGISVRELLLANDSIKWEDKGLTGFELAIPNDLSDQELTLFYEADYLLAPELSGYTKIKDDEQKFVFYKNNETGETDRVWDLQTSPINGEFMGYAKSRDNNTVLLTGGRLLQERGLLYPAYYDHVGTIDKAVDVWKNLHLNSENPLGLSVDTPIEIEVRFSDPNLAWGQQKITKYPGGSYYGIWYSWTEYGSFRLITYVSPGSEEFRDFIFKTLMYTLPDTIALEKKWLKDFIYEPGYPEEEIRQALLPPGKTVTIDTYPIGIRK